MSHETNTPHNATFTAAELRAQGYQNPEQHPLYTDSKEPTEQPATDLERLNREFADKVGRAATEAAKVAYVIDMRTGVVIPPESPEHRSLVESKSL